MNFMNLDNCETTERGVTYRLKFYNHTVRTVFSKGLKLKEFLEKNKPEGESDVKVTVLEIYCTSDNSNGVVDATMTLSDYGVNYVKFINFQSQNSTMFNLSYDQTCEFVNCAVLPVQNNWVANGEFCRFNNCNIVNKREAFMIGNFKTKVVFYECTFGDIQLLTEYVKFCECDLTLEKLKNILFPYGMLSLTILNCPNIGGRSDLLQFNAVYHQVWVNNKMRQYYSFREDSTSECSKPDRRYEQAWSY
jgi:hypothetical protein